MANGAKVIVLLALAAGSLAWGQPSVTARPPGGPCTAFSDGKVEVCYFKGDLNKYAEGGLPTGADYCGRTGKDTFFCLYPIKTPKQEKANDYPEESEWLNATTAQYSATFTVQPSVEEFTEGDTYHFNIIDPNNEYRCVATSNTYNVISFVCSKPHKVEERAKGAK